MESIKEVRQLAHDFAYQEMYFKWKESVIRFERDGKMFDFFFTTFKVGLYEKHKKAVFKKVTCVGDIADLI